MTLAHSILVADPARSDDIALVQMASDYCFAPDGDHRLTWHRAQQDGFKIVSMDQSRLVQSPGVVNGTLRAFTKTVGQKEIRVLTAASWIRAEGQGVTHYRWCWVSSSEDDIRRVDLEMGRLFGGRGFRAAKSRVFAWIPRPDGALEPVPRRIFMRSGLILAREQGLRQATTRRSGNAVFIGYASPRDEQTYRDFDWSGPDPVPASR